MPEKQYAIEMAMTRRHVCYIKSMDTSRWLSDRKVKYFHTTSVPEGSDVPADALKTTYARAFEFAHILEKCRRIVKVVEIEE